MLLLHETDLNALFIVDLVAGLRAAGWTIITMDEAYRDPIAQMEPASPRPAISTVDRSSAPQAPRKCPASGPQACR